MKAWRSFVVNALLLTGGVLAAQIARNDGNRQVEYLDSLHLNTEIGATEVVTVTAFAFNTKESCFIKTPNGDQYTLTKDLNIPGIEIYENDNVACGVSVNVQSEDMIGNWELVAWELRYSDPIEKRLPFTIYVEENVNAASKEVKITEGNDLYIRLENPIELQDTCKLFGPDDAENVNYEVDPNNVDRCGFVVKNIKTEESGKWEIRYGNGKITYRAFTEVTVNKLWNSQSMDLVWTKDRSVDVTVGPEEAIYCKVEDPSGLAVVDGFGNCHIVLSRAQREHTGTWKMTVGFTGSVLTDEYDFTVTVREAEPKPVVTTHVEKQQPVVILSCSVPTQYAVRTCKFRDPSGHVLLANEGVGESRYTFHGAGVSLNSDVQTHECGIRITNPQTSDLGLWRCAVETEQDVYYGFLTVLCPWAMSNPDVAAVVVSEPVLTTHTDTISTVERDPVTMSCSIQSAIKYCYFRARNGTVFSISPGTSSNNLEYVGAGLDAGECGIRFHNLLASDSGTWSCHVGFEDLSQPEQRALFDVTISEEMSAQQYTESGNVLVIQGQVYNNRQLEYCRFVRIDGQGITSVTLPDRYTSYDSLSTGQCMMRIQDASILEHHPWTVAARIVGQDVEVSAVTRHTITIPPTSNPSNANNWIIWLPLMVLGVFLIAIGILLIPKKNRQKTFARMTIIRNSFRDSFQKKPLHDPVQQNNGAMAA